MQTRAEEDHPVSFGDYGGSAVNHFGSRSPCMRQSELSVRFSPNDDPATILGPEEEFEFEFRTQFAGDYLNLLQRSALDFGIL